MVVLHSTLLPCCLLHGTVVNLGGDPMGIMVPADLPLFLLQMETELREHADQIARLEEEKHALERQLESATKVSANEASRARSPYETRAMHI